ncbi:MAG: ABC transporter permease, partial [Clostridiales bacterium]|nr:ABC transporter permease [Clostridiales bacterium]
VSENNIDFEQFKQTLNPEISSESVILGKDTRGNYWYCYALVIIIFMMIIMYGQMIATSVTSEKSNRSVEVLVTTTNPNSLLFGKVIAGAIASLFQMSVILCAAVLTYRVNREAWGGLLDMFLNIPLRVLGIFLLFGLFGYLFYAFIYGAIGALVSRTEDISRSASGVMMVIMVVYFATLFQLSNPDGIVIKVLSFLPISSYSAMFARVALGTVTLVEVIVSFAVLLISVFLAGFLAAKIYRMGTLRYGNPIKLGVALKTIRRAKKQAKKLAKEQAKEGIETANEDREER